MVYKMFLELQHSPKQPKYMGTKKDTKWLHTACLVSSLRFVNYIRGQACASISGGVLANFFNLAVKISTSIHVINSVFSNHLGSTSVV